MRSALLLALGLGLSACGESSPATPDASRDAAPRAPRRRRCRRRRRRCRVPVGRRGPGGAGGQRGRGRPAHRRALRVRRRRRDHPSLHVDASVSRRPAALRPALRPLGPPQPRGRAPVGPLSLRAAFTFDLRRRRMLMFGGRYRAATTGNYTLCMNIRALDLDAGRGRRSWPPAAPRRAPRHRGVLRETDTLVVFGGNTNVKRGLVYAASRHLGAQPGGPHLARDRGGHGAARAAISRRDDAGTGDVGGRGRRRQRVHRAVLARFPDARPRPSDGSGWRGRRHGRVGASTTRSCPRRRATGWWCSAATTTARSATATM